MKISDSVEHKTRLQFVGIVRKHLDQVLIDPDTTDLDVYLHDLVAHSMNQPPLLEKIEEEEELARLQKASRKTFTWTTTMH